MRLRSLLASDARFATPSCLHSPVEDVRNINIRDVNGRLADPIDSAAILA